MAYSIDFRTKVVAYAIHSNNIRETSEKFNIGYHTVRSWLILYNKGEDLKHKSGGKRFEKIDKEKLKDYIDQNLDKFLEEIAKEFGCSPNGIRKALKNIGYTNKKTTIYEEQDKQKVEQFNEVLEIYKKNRRI